MVLVSFVSSVSVDGVSCQEPAVFEGCSRCIAGSICAIFQAREQFKIPPSLDALRHIKVRQCSICG
jgi:hypothetical protein